MNSPNRLNLISEIEHHSLSAIPALKQKEHDGWLLRFANGHTRRANSVNILEHGLIPMGQKIDKCEVAYHEIRQPCHFRLTPLADPKLDQELEHRGYVYSDPTEVRICNLMGLEAIEKNDDVKIVTSLDDALIDALAILTGQSASRQRTFEKMLMCIDYSTLYARIEREGRIIACGLGVMDDVYLGLFEFVTAPAYRRQGLSRKIVQGLFDAAIQSKVKTAYLQVVKSNVAACEFWADMGFTEILYEYHYRSKS